MTDPTPIAVIQSVDAAQYTDPGQYQWFFNRLIQAFGPWCNPRFDADGTTILWYSNYSLPLNSWLVNGKTAFTDDQLKNGAMRPLPDWTA
jgi:hypothetical protein